jgi:hypothetical protein
MISKASIVHGVIEDLLLLRRNTENYILRGFNYLVKHHPPFPGSWIGYDWSDMENRRFLYFKPRKEFFFPMKLDDYYAHQHEPGVCLQQRRFVFYPSGKSCFVLYTSQTDKIISIHNSMRTMSAERREQAVRQVAMAFNKFQAAEIEQEILMYKSFFQTGEIEPLTQKLF